MPKKLAGKKFSGSHTTIIDAAFPLVIKLERNPLVYKISLGLIRKCRSGSFNIKAKEIPSGLELIIRGSLYVQTIYLYITEPETNRETIKEIISG